MPAAHPSESAKSGKPSKPYPEYPLYAHATRRWAKKIRGRTLFFGPWEDPDGALAKYLAEKDALHAGRKPREASEGVTVKVLANSYLNHKQALLDAGELSPHTWRNYQQAAAFLVERLGKSRVVSDLGPDDFAELRAAMTRKKWGPVRVRDFVQRIRSVFKHGLDVGLITIPIRFGPGFAPPKRKTLRIARAEKGPRMFEADELRKLIDGAPVETGDGEVVVKPTVTLRAMILLGVNCGFGNADCGTLPLSALDLTNGWVNYHRPKTGITRRCPLWPETVESLRAVLAVRKQPADEALVKLVFLTARGGSWHKTELEDSTVSKEMRKLLDALGIGGNRNFYALRHTFETIGGEAKDQVAVDAIMGHIRDDMASVYRERISDARLKAVSDYVRAWVFGEDEKAKRKGTRSEGRVTGL
jgi:integrase